MTKMGLFKCQVTSLFWLSKIWLH